MQFYEENIQPRKLKKIKGVPPGTPPITSFANDVT